MVITQCGTSIAGASLEVRLVHWEGVRDPTAKAMKIKFTPQRPQHPKQPARGPAARRPEKPATNPWDGSTADGGRKIYLLTGKDEYLHSADGGRQWARSKIHDHDLTRDDHREKVRAHLEGKGYQNPALTPERLVHVRSAHEGAVDHPGHFALGVDESVHRDRTQEALGQQPEPGDPEDEGQPETIGRPVGGAHLLNTGGERRVFRRGGDEAVARQLDELLGLGVVPDTQADEHDAEAGSKQPFLRAQAAADIDKRVLSGPAHDQRLDAIAVLDALMGGNSSRHMGSVVADSEGQSWSVDHRSVQPGLDVRGNYLWRKRNVTLMPSVRRRMQELSIGDLEKVGGAAVYARMKYLAALGTVEADDLTDQKLQRWVRVNLPHLEKETARVSDGSGEDGTSAAQAPGQSLKSLQFSRLGADALDYPAGTVSLGADGRATGDRPELLANLQDETEGDGPEWMSAVAKKYKDGTYFRAEAGHEDHGALGRETGDRGDAAGAGGVSGAEDGAAGGGDVPGIHPGAEHVPGAPVRRGTKHPLVGDGGHNDQGRR